MGYFPRGGGYVGGSIQWNRYGEPTGDIRARVNTASNPSYLQMIYKTKGHWEGEDKWRSYDYKFPLEKLPCRFGGHKWYVRCQLSRENVFCGRRVRILYSVGDYFGCRHCANLTYESCNQGGRYKGFLSAINMEEQEAKVKRQYYAGKPTKQYRKILRMERKFERSFFNEMHWLQEGAERRKRRAAKNLKNLRHEA